MKRKRHSIQKEETERGIVWHARVDLGDDPLTGKRRQRRVSAPTRKALELKIGDLLARADRGEVVSETRLTVHDYLHEWLAAVSLSLKPLTVEKYRYDIDAQLKRVLGQQRLATFGPLQVQRVVRDLEAAGLAPGTVRTLYGILRAAFKQAVIWGLIQRDPTVGITLPRQTATTAVVWSPEEVRSFLVAARADDLFVLWLLAVTTGMRRGELLGLTWAAVDLDVAVITVERALVPNVRGNGGGYMETTPKTRRGHRRIGISADLVAELRRHHTRQLERKLRNRPRWIDTDWVFTTDTGASLTEHILRSRFDKLIAAAGVPRLRFHDLRHTAATLMLQSGEHPRVVSERLGHATVAMTLDRYTHVDQAMQIAAAERLDAFLKAQKSGGS